MQNVQDLTCGANCWIVRRFEQIAARWYPVTVVNEEDDDTGSNAVDGVACTVNILETRDVVGKWLMGWSVNDAVSGNNMPSTTDGLWGGGVGTGMGERLRERVRTGTDIHGAPIYKWATGYSRRELVENAALLMLRYGNTGAASTALSLTPTGKVPLFEDYYIHWWETYKEPTIRRMTVYNYKKRYRVHLLPAFRGKRLDEITTACIQRFLTDRRHLAKDSLNKLLQDLRNLLESAREDGYIKTNPAKSKRLRIQSDYIADVLRISDGDILGIVQGVTLLEEGRDRNMLALLCHTGLRRGEILGLRWEDVDYDDGVIHIRRGVSFPRKTQPEVGPPKTKASIRMIPLDDRLRTYLSPVASGSGCSGYIVYSLGDEDKPLSLCAYRRMIERINKTVPLNGHSSHQFRHKILTSLYERGVDLKTIQRIAGHSQASTTLDVYVHENDQLIRDAGAVFSGLYTDEE